MITWKGIVFGAALAVSCDHAATQSTGDAVTTSRQGAPPRNAVAINEVMAKPAVGPDWVELINLSDRTVRVGGWFITDELDRFDHYFEFPSGATIAPHQRIVVWATGESHPTRLEAPFRLAAADAVYLLDARGVTVDRLRYFGAEPSRSLARVPDGHGTFELAAPTLGARPND